MFEEAFKCARRNVEEIANAVENGVIMLQGTAGGTRAGKRKARDVARGVRMRLKGGSNDREDKLFIANLVERALDDWSTSTYDWLQRNMNNYQ